MIYKNKLNYLITIFIFLSFLALEAQTYKDMIADEAYKVSQIQEAAYNHFITAGTGRGTGYKQFKRWEYQALRNQNEQGYLIKSIDTEMLNVHGANNVQQL